jgi:Tfp pilus assembly protein PilW
MKRIDYPAENRENGVSLIELLFAMGIFMVVLAAIASVFISQRKSYDVQEQVAEMTQAARSAIDMLSTEIRLAGYRLPDAVFGMPYSTSQLRILADIDDDAGNGVADGDTLDQNENIIYTYDSANLRINRNDVNTDNVAHPFAENIEGFSFTYFEGDGVTEVASTDDNDKIRQIEIKIVARTSKPAADYSTNEGYRVYTLTSRVTPTNLGL